jgi:hypothetical protein
MEHQFGRVDIVAWQDRRLRDSRSGLLTPALATTFVICATLLILRFVANLPLPLELLQAAFALLMVSGAFLVMRRTVDFIRRLQQR